MLTDALERLVELLTSEIPVFNEGLPYRDDSIDEALTVIFRDLINLHMLAKLFELTLFGCQP